MVDAGTNCCWPEAGKNESRIESNLQINEHRKKSKLAHTHQGRRSSVARKFGFQHLLTQGHDKHQTNILVSSTWHSFADL